MGYTYFVYSCLDIILDASLPIEYTKLIVASLDYTRTGITHVILQSALVSTNEVTTVREIREEFRYENVYSKHFARYF